MAKPQEDAHSKAAGASHDDPPFDPYRYGVYYNPSDSRLWLPKRIAALGWTVNFAHPWAIPVVLLLVLGPLLISLGFVLFIMKQIGK